MSEADASPGKEQTQKPNKFWYTMIMYPTLAVALIGAVPQYIEQWKSFRLDIPKDQLSQEQQQREMWEINFDCTREVFPHVVVTKEKIHIEVTTCPTGDILIITRKPGHSRPTTKWISSGDK